MFEKTRLIEIEMQKQNIESDKKRQKSERNMQCLNYAQTFSPQTVDEMIANAVKFQSFIES